MSYGKVHQAYWESDTIAGLSDDAALLGLFLISGPHRNAIGCFKLGIGAITDHPRFAAWGSERASKALQELVRSTFVARDERTGWILIRNALKHDPITSPNGAVGAVKLANLVPENSEIYQELVERLSPQLDEILKDKKKVPGYPLRPPSKGLNSRSEGPSKVLRTPEPQPTPEPQQQPAAAQGPSDAVPSDPYPKLRERVEQVLNSPTITNFNRIRAWLDQGADPWLDILPAIEASMAKRGDAPKSLKYFDGVVADFYAARTAAVPPGKAPMPAGKGNGPRMVPRHEARDVLEAVGLLKEPDITTPVGKAAYPEWQQKREAHLRSQGIDPRSLLQ